MKAPIINSSTGGGGWWGDWFNSSLGRMIKGIIKLVLATLVISLVSVIPKYTPNNITVNGTVIPVLTITEIIVAFVPIFLVISALYDFDIRI